jgi:hypothetical protein
MGTLTSVVDDADLNCEESYLRNPNNADVSKLNTLSALGDD